MRSSQPNGWRACPIIQAGKLRTAKTLVTADFDNDTAVNYEENTVFGFQGSLSVEHDITRLLFVNLGVRNNNDFSDLLESANSDISVDSYGFFFGMGIRIRL